MRWIPFAMVRIAAVFMAGILLSIYYPEVISEKQATIFLIIFTAMYFLVRFLLDRSPSIKVVTGGIGLGVIFFAGYLNVILKMEPHQTGHVLQCKERIVAYEAKVISPGEEKEKSWKRIGSIRAIRTENGWRLASGKVNLYWPKTEQVALLDYGDVLLINGAPREIDSPYNPYEFDFKRFSGFKNIYHQQFVKQGEWTLMEKSNEHGFLFYAYRARNWSVASIKNFISSPREQGIVVALVLGVTDGLDNELLNAYAASGAMHVLAVSGLHVSIIYGILLFFFRPVGKSVGGQWIVAVVSLMLLWSYAFITGLSPSVLRAVTMFSFVAIAKPVGRNTNIYNTLAASAFCLLIYDPYLIMSLGFQLSYLAVLGIVYLQRPIYNLWEVKSAIMDWAWQISCVSIAAQIATFALGLLYFHQFPVYFLLSNLFIIPGSFVVLVGGILLLIISPFATFASWLGVALEWFVRIMNEGVFLVEQLPFSLINGIYISAFQCFLLFLFILCSLFLIQYRRFQAVYLMTASVALFVIVSWHHAYTEINKSNWIVYRVQGHSVMEWSENGSSLFLTDSAFLDDNTKIRFHVQPNRLVHGIRNVYSVCLLPKEIKGLQFYSIHKKTFLWIKSKEFQLPQHVAVDYVIVSNNAIKSLRQIADHINFNQVVFDSSNSYRYCERLEKEAKAMNKSSHSVLKDRAFILNL